MLLLNPCMSVDPDERFMDSVLYFTGAADIPEVPESEFEHYEALHNHPLDINLCSRSALGSSRLFSPYQVESLLDYRERSGAILSVRELGLVDGFGPEFAERLLPFISIESGSAAAESGLSHHGDLTCKGGGRISRTASSPARVSPIAAGRGEYRLSTPHGGYSAALAYRYGNMPSGSLSYESAGFSVASRVPRTLAPRTSLVSCTAVLGAFNARFGQGLMQWSGVSIDSYSTPSALMKRPAGITAYKGWSGQYAMLGAACTVSSRHWELSPYADIMGGRYGMYGQWRHRSGSAGAQLAVEKGRVMAGLDFQHTLKGTVIFGEAAYLGAADFNSLAGFRSTFGNTDVAARISAGSDEVRAAAAVSYGQTYLKHFASLGFSARYAIDSHGNTPRGAAQGKILLDYEYRAPSGWRSSSRMSASLKALTARTPAGAPYSATWPMLRADFRQNAGYCAARWSFDMRTDVLYLRNMRGASAGMTGGALSVDGALHFAKVSAHLQASAFIADDWDARIYVYQYDAPGSFSLAALYGRGYCVSAYSRIKITGRSTLHLRCAYVYGRCAEAAIQLDCRF